jgi:hypothetical protein
MLSGLNEGLQSRHISRLKVGRAEAVDEKLTGDAEVILDASWQAHVELPASRRSVARDTTGIRDRRLRSRKQSAYLSPEGELGLEAAEVLVKLRLASDRH